MESIQKKIGTLFNDDTSSGRKNQPQHPQIQQEEEDRLSSLPDNLLVSILSLLPIHFSATTSALSRRWRHLWTHITHLSLDFSSHRPFKSAVTIIHHIFSQLKSPKIHSFHLHLDKEDYYFSHDYISSGILVPWIHHICSRNPGVFKLNVGGIYSIHGRPYKIPICLFEAQSLVQLELRMNVEFDLNHDNTRMLSSIELPNLKKLTLELSDAHIPLINVPLLKACPILQDLYLYLYLIENDDLIVDISSPNLKYLSLDVVAHEVGNCKLVIDAPMLEKFFFQGDLTFYDFVNNPSNLQEAEISIIERFFAHDYDMSKFPGLIQGICSVRSLVLQDFSIFLLGSIDRLDVLPVFHNLIYLSFSYAKGPSRCITKLPRCFLSGNLKRVDVRHVFPENLEIKLFKHILSNAAAEKLCVYVCPDLFLKEDQAKIEYKACKKLFKHSKNSVNCQIEFYGLKFNASSKDFRDGVLTYQTSH